MPRRFLPFLCGIVLVLAAIASIPLPACAQSVDDLRAYQQQVEQQRQVLQKQQEQIRALTAPAQDRLNALHRHVRDTDARINANRQKLAQAEAKLKRLETDLEVAERTLTAKRIAAIARLRYLQRQNAGQWWTILLSSRDLSEFASRRHQIARIYNNDRRLLATLKRDADRVASQRDDIVKQRNEIVLLNQQLAHQKANLEAEAIAQSNVVSRLKSDRRALELAEERLAQDSRQITALILAKTQTPPGIGFFPGTGQLVYPTVGPIVSNFGWRMHPILGYEKFHSGLDFGADYGSPIYAADSGTVIFAGWYGGYGNAVILNHGNGLSTLYAHASELYVEEGQQVQKGQPIAAVGSTGFSTGPHLHFEVRNNGEPTDPLYYL